MADISEAFSPLKLDDELYPSHHHFDFLALPGELRNQIYRLTLTTDPPRLYRQHKYSCKWCTWGPDDPQKPMIDGDGQKLPDCRCCARPGLALLLANRKINEEAASIFWAENHFSFEGFDSFILLVGGRLRPQYRQMIPDITIYYSDPGRRRETLKMFDRDPPPVWFWGVLFKCKGLRTLEIPPYHSHIPESIDMRLADMDVGSWYRVTSELPNLRWFSWSYFGYCFEREHVRGFKYPYRMTKRVDLRQLSPDQFRRYGAFSNTDFVVSRTSYLRAFPFGPRGPRPGEVIVSAGRPDEHQYTHKNKPEVKHSKVRVMSWAWIVEFFFLPLSPETIARNAVLKARDEDTKKAEEDADSS